MSQSITSLMAPTEVQPITGVPACAEVDPEVFFPVSEVHTAQIERAKRICASCPLAVECLRVALETGERGVWGGTTESERRALRASRRRARQQQEQEQEQGQGGEFSEGVQAA